MWGQSGSVGAGRIGDSLRVKKRSEVIDQGEKEQGFYVAHPASLVLCSMVRQVAKAQVQRRGLRLQLDVSSSVLA